MKFLFSLSLFLSRSFALEYLESNNRNNKNRELYIFECRKKKKIFIFNPLNANKSKKNKRIRRK